MDAMNNFNTNPRRGFFCGALLAVLTWGTFFPAVAQIESTPYDLIRPVWPLTWDPTIFDTFVPGVRQNSLPVNRTPQDFAPNTFVPDTLNQAFRDALNLRISRIRVNQAGYLPTDPEKQIYYVGAATAFEVVDETGAVLGNGTFSPIGVNTSSGYRIVAGHNAQRNMNIRYTAQATGPSGPLQRGHLPGNLPLDRRLRVRVAGEYSSTFVISERVYSMVRDATLKFMGINRSGNSESWFHPPSNLLDGSGRVVDRGGTFVRMGNQPGALTGGWYDCGDHLKESQTQAYAFMALSVLAATLPERDDDNYAYNHGEINNTDGIPDLLREARHGADFLLRAYDFANGNIDQMPLSIGNFGADHGWWGRPEFRDFIPTSVTGRGGPHERDIRLGELGSNVSGQFAAGLALLSVHYRRFDAPFADRALRVARELYTFARQLALGQITPQYNNIASGWASAAYNGNNEHHDDLGLAAIALLYATADTSFLFDATENPQMVGGQTKSSFINNLGGAGMFRGGWFTHRQASIFKDVKNTSWANSYAFTLYAFYKLILATEAQALRVGINNQRRLQYIEDVVLTMAANLADMGMGSATIVLPSGAAMWKRYQAQFDPVWFRMHTDQSWIYNRYQAGNIFEVLALADVTKDLEGMALPNLGVRQWRSAELLQLGINQMNYMLGVNPWDMSWLLGVGDKHDAHPHHRAANPEGKNVPGGDYRYRPPTGAMFGGIPPDVQPGNLLTPSTLSWEDYHISETCIDGTVNFIAPSILLAKQENINRAPQAAVEIRHVGFDSAIVIVRQDMFGSARISYGTDPAAMNTVISSTTNGVMHTFILRPLTPGTAYYFTATTVNERSGNESVRFLVDSTRTPYNFTTLSSPPPNADIQNVRVCNVSADSAEIMWFTPNGEYESKIYWDTVLVPHQNMRWSQTGNSSGGPTRFHLVQIGGLQERTTYYYAVESNGVVRATDENNRPLSFRTPVMQYDFSVRASQYAWSGMSGLELNIYNNEARPFDSLTLRVYMRGTDALTRDIGIRMDICQAYNEAGFNNPCSPATIQELTGLFRVTFPVKLEDTYDAASGTWQWYFPIPLGSTVIRSSSRMRLDVFFDRRSPWTPDLMNQAPEKRLYCQREQGTRWYTPDFAGGTPIAANPGDWTWMPHVRAAGAPVDYRGLPCEVKDFGDADMAPINPYIVVYRKDEFVWGYSPSRAEQITKRSNYNITTTLQAPFDASNDSYIELDGASSTVRVRGTATISENGVVTDIWVNGQRVVDLASAAVYNPVTQRFDLNIPVRMAIGANKIDVTIFAGPSLDCPECREYAGCAFVNHSWFVQYSRGNFTASSLVLNNAATGGSIVSPVTTTPDLQFNIIVRDQDKLAGSPAGLPVLVINAQQQDTLRVQLVLDPLTGTFRSANPIQTSATPGAGPNRIVFMGGDTIRVVYTDPDDEEDISQQSFFAQATFPSLVSATLRDSNCDGVADLAIMNFSQAFNAASLDSLWMVIRDPGTSNADSFAISVPAATQGLAEISVSLPARPSIPAIGNPLGSLTAFVRATGSTTRHSSQASLADGIAPRLLGVSILENPDGAYPFDTVMISFSEPVSLQSRTQWPLQVTEPAGITGNLTVQGQAGTANDGMSWQYALSGNTNSSLLDSGYRVTVLPNFAISDLSFNTMDVAACPQLVTVEEVPRPVPVRVAFMQDTTQDGAPDQVRLTFERRLRNKDMLDSFVIQWGAPAIQRVLRPLQARTWDIGYLTSQRQEVLLDPQGLPVFNADSTPVMVSVTDSQTVITIPFNPDNFPFGTTQGHRDGRGLVMPRLGPIGGFFDRQYSLNDSVGPLLTTARLERITGSLYSLQIAISEPVDTLMSFFVERRRGTQILQLQPNFIRNNAAADSSFILQFTGSDNEQVRVGDFVRLIAHAPSVLDQAGMPPPLQAPWVPVRGALESEIRFQVRPLVALTPTLQGSVSEYAQDPPDAEDIFRLTIMHPSLGQQRKLAEGSNKLEISSDGIMLDTNVYRHLGPTLEIRVRIPQLSLVADRQLLWNYMVNLQVSYFDNLGQFVNQMEFSLNLDDLPREYIDADESITLRLEWMAHDGKGPRSRDGRLVGSGAYIASANLRASGVARQDDPAVQQGEAPAFQAGTVRRSSQTIIRRIGIMR